MTELEKRQQDVLRDREIIINNLLNELGWHHSQPIQYGGWIHEDVRDDDGAVRVFVHWTDVIKYKGCPYSPRI